MTDAKRNQGAKAGRHTRRGIDLGVGRAGAAAAPATIAEECKRRRGGEPCIRTYAANLVTVTVTYDCVEWCPVLQKRLGQQYEPKPYEVAA